MRFLLFLLLALPIQAQESNFRIYGQGAISAGAGFENPVLGGRLGGTVNFGRVALDGYGGYDFAKKIPGGGHSVSGNLSARIWGKKYFLGPAFHYVRQTTSLYYKDSVSIGAEGGALASKRLYVSGRFLQDVKSVNKTRRYDFRVEYYGKSHFYLTAQTGLQDFKCMQGPNGLTDHCFSGHSSIGLGLYFR